MGLLLKEMCYKGSREDILAEGKGAFNNYLTIYNLYI